MTVTTTEPMGNFLVSSGRFKALHYTRNNVTKPNDQIFCILEIKPCVCLDQWEDGNYSSLCLNQQGCTFCGESDKAWCHTTEYECDGVEHDIYGTALGWFYCGDEQFSTGVF